MILNITLHSSEQLRERHVHCFMSAVISRRSTTHNTATATSSTRRGTRLSHRVCSTEQEHHTVTKDLFTQSVFPPGEGGTPYTEVYMYVPRKCPCFWPFFSLCPKKFFLFSLFVPQLNLIILSFIEEEISL